MAIYRLSAQIIGRSTQRSVVAGAAYRAGARLRRAETGTVHDYRRKGGVLWSGILAPDDAPGWARDREQLWNNVEAKERRRNAQLAREIILSLPNELGLRQACRLVLGWVHAELVSRGMVADIAIHDPRPEPGRPRNLHAHVLLTLRKLAGDTPDGWAQHKERAWNSRAFLLHLRASWADAVNRALRDAGIDARVDHRRLAAQAAVARAEGRDQDALILDRPPEPCLGVAVAAIERKARRRAAREGRRYVPVTPRGREVAEVRAIRRRLVRLQGLVRAIRQSILWPETGQVRMPKPHGITARQAGADAPSAAGVPRVAMPAAVDPPRDAPRPVRPARGLPPGQQPAPQPALQPIRWPGSAMPSAAPTPHNPEPPGRMGFLPQAAVEGARPAAPVPRAPAPAQPRAEQVASSATPRGSVARCDPAPHDHMPAPPTRPDADARTRFFLRPLGQLRAAHGSRSGLMSGAERAPATKAEHSAATVPYEGQNGMRSARMRPDAARREAPGWPETPSPEPAKASEPFDQTEPGVPPDPPDRPEQDCGPSF